MLLGFQTRFVPMILAHTKRHTIRAKRKIAPRVGEICHCYTGLRQRGPIIQKFASGQVVRQKMTRLLGRWPCVNVQEIQIKGSFHAYAGFIGGVLIERQVLSQDECEALARSDGFETFTEMMEFWRGRLPFRGDIIHWDPTKPAAAPTRSSARRRPGFKPKEKL